MITLSQLKAAFALLCMALLCSTARAQGGTGTVTGRLLASDGHPASFVVVALEGSTTKATSTDEKGYFMLGGLPAGEVKLVVLSSEFEPQPFRATVQPGKTVSVGEVSLQETTRELKEVEVTGVRRRTGSATRTNQELIDIPMSIQQVNQEIIQQQNAFDLVDVTRNISGVFAVGNYQGAGSYQYFSSRGFDLNNWQNYRRNGFMVWNMGNHFSDNIESVEFLKGPTSILYGDISPGGVLNMVTKKPLAYEYRRAELKVGQYGLIRPTMDVTGPLNEKKTLLYRLNATYEQSNSFRDQVESQGVMFAPSVTWQIAPRLDWNVEYTFKSTSASNDPGIVSPDGTFERLDEVGYTTYLGEPGMTYDYTDQGLYSTLTYQVSDAWRVRQLASYGYTARTPYGIYFDGTVAPNGDAGREEYSYRQWFDTRTVGLELLGNVQTGSIGHTILIGADYFDSYTRYTDGINNPIDPINIYNPVYGQAALAHDNTPWSNFRYYYKRLGAYAQDQVSFGDGKVQVLLGVRFNQTSQGNAYDNEEDRPEGDDEFTVNPISPRIGVVYKPIKWLAFFGSYTNSYEVNTPDLGADNGADYLNPEPTKSLQVEGGVKANLLEDRLGVTLTGFTIRKDDIFGYIDVPGGYEVYQGGTHRSRGVELDVNGRVNENLNLIASGAYIDAYIDHDVSFESGNRLAGTPTWSGSLWANYELTKGTLKGLLLGYGVFHRGSFYGTAENLNETKGVTTMDASLGYKLDNVTFRVNATNLANREYFTQYYSSNTWNPQWTRRIIGSVAVEF